MEDPVSMPGSESMRSRDERIEGRGTNQKA
jgi:hypothetical protein